MFILQFPQAPSPGEKRLAVLKVLNSQNGRGLRNENPTSAPQGG